MLTSIEFINGVGQEILLILILIWIQVVESLFNNNLDDGIAITKIVTKYTNNEISLQLLKHFEKLHFQKGKIYTSCF